MESFEMKMKNYSLIVLSLLGILLVGYVLLTWKTVFLGAFVGFLFGFLSLWTTYIKTKVIGEAAAGVKSYTSISYFIAIFGIAIRMGLAIIPVWMAILQPERLNIIAVIAGYSLIYIIIMTDMLVHFARKR
ncbi:hypothetical protein EJF36_19820 [Bacillus sp. HMF5848]|uniref:ATP synthase subunit I n=1 Tax=Bacillus sp. HMF5848 TaxID=2495421 RepID=UPI000F76C68C|nr:ATP synthase subunit I [Bacillus sp. HMF5848]RSK28947.1 hypothetical protein EJF36_19820 [Bacillus sp. HMF5848]